MANESRDFADIHILIHVISQIILTGGCVKKRFGIGLMECSEFGQWLSEPQMALQLPSMRARCR